jgi:hypothetical protein
MNTGTIFRANGYLDLPTVTDKLHRYAVGSGVVRELGQDEVQHILSSAFVGIKREPIE